MNTFIFVSLALFAITPFAQAQSDAPVDAQIVCHSNRPDDNSVGYALKEDWMQTKQVWVPKVVMVHDSKTTAWVAREIVGYSNDGCELCYTIITKDPTLRLISYRNGSGALINSLELATMPGRWLKAYADGPCEIR